MSIKQQLSMQHITADEYKQRQIQKNVLKSTDDMVLTVDVERLDEVQTKGKFLPQGRKTSRSCYLCLVVSMKDKPNPKLHTIKKSKTGGVSKSLVNPQYSLKKSKQLKSLTSVEFSPKGTGMDFALTFGTKRYHWKCHSRDICVQFCWWMLETCRVFLSLTPKLVNFAKYDLDTITNQLLAADDEENATPEDIERIAHLTDLQQTILEHKRHDLECGEKEVTNQIKIPNMSVEEAKELEFHLAQAGLDLSDIGLLEERLSAQLVEYEHANVKAFFQKEVIDGVAAIKQELGEHTTDLLEELNLWIKAHDQRFSKMSSGIQQIEEKNRLLEVREHNNQALARVTRQLFDNLSISQGVEYKLKDPNFNDPDTIEAVKVVASACNIKLPSTLEKMKAVQHLRKRNDHLKGKLCDSMIAFFRALFQDQAKLATSRISSAMFNKFEFRWHVEVHENILKYKDLRILEQLSPKKFLSLRDKYATAIAKVYDTQVKAIFADMKSLIVIENKDTRLNDFPEYVFMGGVSLAPRSRRRNSDDGPALARTSTQLALDIQGKRLITQAYGDALSVLIPAIVKEHAFCSEFFGLATGETTEVAKLDGQPQSALAESKDEDSVGVERAATALKQTTNGQVTQMMEQIFASVKPGLRALVDWGNRMDHFYSLTMLVETDRFIKEDEMASEFVVGILMGLQRHLVLLFTQFIDEEVKWIHGLSVSAKRCGVLVPFLKFPSFVERMESVLNGRQFGESMYKKLAIALFQWLDKIAQQDSKYADVVYMENFHYFWNIFSHREEPVEALEDATEKAHEGFKRHALKYVKWNVSYEMPEVSKFWDLLKTTTESIPFEDVPFTAGLSKHDLRQLTKEKGSPLAEKTLRKAIGNMHRRVVKHLPNNNTLLKEVWAAMQRYFCTQFRGFEELVKQCYENEKLPISTSTIESMFQEHLQVDLTTSNAITELTSAKTAVPQSTQRSKPTTRLDRSKSDGHIHLATFLSPPRMGDEAKEEYEAPSTGSSAGRKPSIPDSDEDEDDSQSRSQT